MCIQVATAMLFSMAFVVSFPALWLAQFHVNPATIAASLVTVALGVLAAIVAVSKTWNYIGWVSQEANPPIHASRVRRIYDRLGPNVYFILNLAPWTTLIGVPCLWAYLCCTRSAFDPASPHGLDFVGLCFSYRYIHPCSGVSPIVPVLLLLLSWYLWALFQTLRLRFSEKGRPRLPKKLPDADGGRLYVSDDALELCESARYPCLYKNMTCLLITRQLIWRFFGLYPAATPGPNHAPNSGGGTGRDLPIDMLLGVTYGSVLLSVSLFTPVHSIDRLLWSAGPYFSCPYEILVSVLFFPLVAMSLTGWIRMILIWGALRRGLLERLENLPLRFAFSRLKVMGWMTMLRSGGLQEHWSDMARGLESIRQILHRPVELETMREDDRRRLEYANQRLQADIVKVRERFDAPGRQPQCRKRDYELMKDVELGFAAFGQELLSTILIPYWSTQQSRLVESEESCDGPENSQRSRTDGPAPTEPPIILLAEEFLAIRYISLIRSVLANLRYLMIFVTASFVLAILAWNSYPFQPSQLGDLLFTGMLLILGSGVIWVFAQMHRNPILSRITETRVNELGWDFYWRILSFGALPVFTWLAYQFPEVGNLIAKFVQPGVSVLK
jgi:hypothetical protein